jgi:hypothetical protein
MVLVFPRGSATTASATSVNDEQRPRHTVPTMWGGYSSSSVTDYPLIVKRKSAPYRYRFWFKASETVSTAGF